MKTFDRDMLEPGLIIAGRNPEGFKPRLIRGILNSYTNHNCLILKHNTRGYLIGETDPPKSHLTPLSTYEDMMNDHGYIVRVWRICDATDEERLQLGYHWQDRIDGRKYNEIAVMRLVWMRIVNSFPWRIHGNWCTRAIGEVCALTFPPERNPFRKPDGRIKKNETPRTLENRLVAGILDDVTDLVISK